MFKDSSRCGVVVFEISVSASVTGGVGRVGGEGGFAGGKK